MAILFDGAVTPDALTAFVRRVPMPEDLALLNAVPAHDNTSNTVNFAEIVKRNRTAKYRSFDGRIHVSARDAGSLASVSMIPLSDSRNMGEYERLKLEFARTGGTNTAILADAIYNDGEDLVGNIYRRLELALGDVLTDGVLTVSEIDAGFEADFGVPATSKVTATTLWGAAGADIITDLRNWHDVYVTAAGAPAGAIRTSRQVLRLVLSNASVIAAVHGTQAGRTFTTLTDLNAFLGAMGLPPFVETYDTVLDVDGVDTRPIPANRVLFTPADLGSFVQVEWGVTATALELVDNRESDLTFEDAGRIVGVIEKVGPPYREFTFVDAVAMPVLTDARKIFIAKVLA